MEKIPFGKSAQSQIFFAGLMVLAVLTGCGSGDGMNPVDLE
jgi:hypothetical protein